MFKCKKCGGTDVEVKVWYNLKTEIPSTEYLTTQDDEDTWCCNCQEHTGVEWIGDDETQKSKY